LWLLKNGTTVSLGEKKFSTLWPSFMIITLILPAHLVYYTKIQGIIRTRWLERLFWWVGLTKSTSSRLLLHVPPNCYLNHYKICGTCVAPWRFIWNRLFLYFSKLVNLSIILLVVLAYNSWKARINSLRFNFLHNIDKCQSQFLLFLEENKVVFMHCCSTILILFQQELIYSV